MRRLFSILRNKYLLSGLVFLVWLTFFDKNDFFSQYKSRKKLNDLYKEKEFYRTEIKQDSTSIHELMSNPANLEKFGREKYLMKRDNEDIFVFVEEKTK